MTQKHYSLMLELKGASLRGGIYVPKELCSGWKLLVCLRQNSLRMWSAIDINPKNWCGRYAQRNWKGDETVRWYIQIINFTTFYLPFLNPKMNLREYRITSIQVLQCKWNPSKTALKIRGYETLYGLSEPALACIVERVGPVVVGFDASGAGLQHYKYVPGGLNWLVLLLPLTVRISHIWCLIYWYIKTYFLTICA